MLGNPSDGWKVKFGDEVDLLSLSLKISQTSTKVNLRQCNADVQH